MYEIILGCIIVVILVSWVFNEYRTYKKKQKQIAIDRFNEL